MASVTFNTLKYANRLKQAGVSPEQAEALAEVLATHQSELATKTDLVALKNELKSDITAIKAEMAAMEASLNAKMTAMEARLDAKMTAMEERLDAKIEKMALTPFIKLGSLMAGLIALLGGGLALLIRMQ